MQFNRAIFTPVSLVLTIGTLSAAVPSATIAKTPLPAEVRSIVTKIDQAANGKRLPELLKHYSPSFTTTDGLTRNDWQKSISQFWQNYSNVTYTTTIESWKPDGQGYSIDTITKVNGSQSGNGKVTNLAATIKSRQNIAGGQILRQQVLSERTQVTTGTQPPTIELTLPDRLSTNAEYSVDAIVKEPLGEDVLMGAMLEQPVSPQTYAQSSNAEYKLELLNSGGLFKTVRAPGKSGDYWLSAIFIRPSGMTTVTQRIRVVRPQ
jgi:hypothetical protein